MSIWGNTPEDRVACLFHNLQCPMEASPQPGFYGRVVSCIDNNRPQSMWSSFDCPAASRVASAVAAVVLLLAVLAYSDWENFIDKLARAGHHSGELVIPVRGDVNQQRDAVLSNFALLNTTECARGSIAASKPECLHLSGRHKGGSHNGGGQPFVSDCFHPSRSQSTAYERIQYLRCTGGKCHLRIQGFL